MSAEGSPRPPALPGSQPVSGRERIRSLDVMRGFAVCGILVINIASFAMVEARFENPSFGGSLDGANFFVWLFGYLFVQGRAITIFSVLFGAGIILSTRRRDEAGLPGAARFYRRYGILAGIGLVHAYFLWFGDILLAYALCAFLVYLLRRASIKVLVILGLGGQLALPLFLLSAQALMALPEFAAEMEATWNPPDEVVAAEIAQARGDYPTWFRRNALLALEAQFYGIPFMILWFCGGLMLLGMALLRSGFFDLAWRARAYWTGALAGCGGGLVFGVLSVMIHLRTGWAVESSMLALLPMEVGALLGAYGYLCAGMLIVRAGILPILTGTLAAIGRMALTNYLGQSVICSFLFAGWGLGWFEQLDRLAQFGIVLVILALQALGSVLWLQIFRMGPAEWLWRRLSYGRIGRVRRSGRGGNSE